MYPKTTLLDSIDNITNVVNESSIDVLDALIDSYDKAELILENYDGDDLSAFSIFQEGKILDEVKKKGKNDSMIKKIALFIPRLIAALFSHLGKLISDVSKEDTLEIHMGDKLPTVIIEKAEKDPNFLKKILKSKPMKIVTAFTAIKVVDSGFKSIKKMHTNVKETKETAAENMEAAMTRETLKEPPTVAVFIDNDSKKLFVQSTINLETVKNLSSKYFTEVFALIKASTSNIRKCKTLLEVNTHMNKLATDIRKNMIIYDAMHDPEAMKTFVPYDVFDNALRDCFKDFKTRKEYFKEQLTKEMEALLNAVQSEHHMKGIENKSFKASVDHQIKKAKKANEDFFGTNKEEKDTAEKASEEEDSKTDASKKKGSDFSAVMDVFKHTAEVSINQVILADLQFALSTLTSTGKDIRTAAAAVIEQSKVKGES